MSVDQIAKKMSKASGAVLLNPPKTGEKYRCQPCGMEFQITADCRCKDASHVQFQCCGQPMTKV